MPSIISSRTPEGLPNSCPVCRAAICIEPSQPTGDAPCPQCGILLWFFHAPAEMRCYDSRIVEPVRQKIISTIAEQLGVEPDNIRMERPLESLFFSDIGADSLDAVETVMSLEEDLEINISARDGEHIFTVGDLVDAVVRHENQVP